MIQFMAKYSFSYSSSLMVRKYFQKKKSTFAFIRLLPNKHTPRMKKEEHKTAAKLCRRMSSIDLRLCVYPKKNPICLSTFCHLNFCTFRFFCLLNIKLHTQILSIL